MKTRFLISVITLLIFALLSSSFIIEKKPKHPYKKFKAPKTYAYIPSGTLITQQVKTKVALKGFFMSKGEISNKEYNDFLNDLILQGRNEDHEIAKHHPEKWKSTPFETTYHKHPSYDDYPVVTISKEGAEMYCKWLTEKLQASYPKFNINFRLPTEQEWIYAAKGGYDLAPYPWGGYYLRNSKGQMLANFKRVGSGNISFNRITKTYEVKVDNLNNFSLPAPSYSYHPNNYGLFNMSGNAAEMLSTIASDGNGNRTKGGCFDSGGYDITIEAPDQFEGWTEPSPYIGFRPVLDVSYK